MVDGFNRRSAPKPGQAQVRNLLGFKDGTANLDAGDDGDDGATTCGWPPVTASPRGRSAARTTWCGSSGCSSSAGTARRWASRRRSSAGTRTPAPRSAAGARPTSPTSPTTPTGRSRRSTRTSAWPTPAPPRRDENLILRRGLSYSRGFDGNGKLDQGLAFVCFQRSLEKGFLAVQGRLDGEPLEEYIRAEGGGFFFALPGVRGKDDWLGRTLFS